MIYAEIHNKKFKLYCNNFKIRNPYLSDDERRYIKACVEDILLNYDNNEADKTEFVAKNLPDYGIKVIRYYDTNKDMMRFLEFFIDVPHK